MMPLIFLWLRKCFDGYKIQNNFCDKKNLGEFDTTLLHRRMKLLLWLEVGMDPQELTRSSSMKTMSGLYMDILKKHEVLIHQLKLGLVLCSPADSQIPICKLWTKNSIISICDIPKLIEIVIFLWICCLQFTNSGSVTIKLIKNRNRNMELYEWWCQNHWSEF